MRTPLNRDDLGTVTCAVLTYVHGVSERDDDLEDLGSDPLLLAGVWADWTRVHWGRSVFTIDFIRRVPDPMGRLLVARAVVAPIVGLELREQLDATWKEYSDWSMPRGRR